VTNRSVTHATFVIERTYAVAPAQVFTAWADPASKRRWFGAPNEAPTEFDLDFRVGGREINRGLGPDGRSYTYDARYQDIVPNERIVYAYEMHLGEMRISVSLGTVEFKPEGAATRLIYTEQGAFLDGLDTPADREHGTRELLDALGRVLQSPSARDSS
jgi:uncharacterized protein YndB with AHSA1/START domain